MIVVVGVSTGFQRFTSCGIQFNASFLCHLLSVFGCRGRTDDSASQHRFVRAVLGCLEGIRFQLCVEDYLVALRALMELKMFDE